MEHWDLRSLDVEPHKPTILHSARGEARSIAINLPAGEELQEHQTHESAFLIVADGEVEVVHDSETVTGGAGLVASFEANERREVRAKNDALLVLILNPWPGEGHPRRQHEQR